VGLAVKVVVVLLGVLARKVTVVVAFGAGGYRGNGFGLRFGGGQTFAVNTPALF